MVAITDIRSSNARIASALPAGLIAVFVGATNGIGETSLKEFARHTVRPRVYFVGRSQEAGDRIAQECKALNADGEFIFIKADVSLLRTVDDVCRDIKSKESVVNLLFLSQGSLVLGTETTEKLTLFMALAHYSRVRFIVNLLPLLQRATALRRVISVLAGGKEGAIQIDDIQRSKLSMMAGRAHSASVVTLSLEALARKAPDVMFMHEFPGVVQSGILRGTTGVAMFLMKTALALFGPFLYIPIQESGERHLFMATSARFPAGSENGAKAVAAVPLEGDVAIARGTNGQSGSGVYSMNWDAESSGPQVEALLAGFRNEGLVDMVWKDIQKEFTRITGSEAM